MKLRLAAVLLLMGCPGPAPEELLKRLEQKPADVETATALAMAGRPMIPGLVKLLEKYKGIDEASTRIRQSATAVMYCAGDACAYPLLEYWDNSPDTEVNSRILRVIGRGKWTSAVRKLVNRIDHSVMGAEVYQCLVQICGSSCPEDPWSAADENEKTRRFAAWAGWLARQGHAQFNVDMRNTTWKASQETYVRGLVEKELNNPDWR